MFVRKKPIGTSGRYRVQVCDSRRVSNKVKQKVIQHVGIAENESHLIDMIKLAHVIRKQLEEKQNGPSLFDIDHYKGKKPQETLVTIDKTHEEERVRVAALLEKKRTVEGFHEIFGALFKDVGFHILLTQKPGEVLRDILLARIARPASKRSSQSILSAHFGKDIDLDRIYRMMDLLIEKKDEVLKRVFAATQELCFDTIDLLLFDVTTLYFESTEEDELRAFGYSKDQKFHSVQVVLALATTNQGLPIGYKLFPGDTADVSTLIACIEEWKKTLPIGKARFIGDRAMMTEANLKKLEEMKMEYVIAAKLKKLPIELQNRMLQAPKDSSQPILDQLHNNRRLIVTYSHSRAEKDAKDRQRILDKIQKKIGKGKSAKKLISNRGYQKYLSSSGDAKLVLNEEKIAQDASWDGLHGLITNCSSSSQDLLNHYKRLWVIEESFRIHKHDLSVRPIYHFKPERIEAHILLCYMAFALMRYLEYRMKIQKEPVSMATMREELWRVQASLFEDIDTGKKYRLPSAMSPIAKKMYHAFGITRDLRAKAEM